MKNKSLIFLILSFVMGSISLFWGSVLNNLNVAVHTRIYHYSNTTNFSSYLKNITAEHLIFLNIFFAVLFAVFLTLSIVTSIKENKN